MEHSSYNVVISHMDSKYVSGQHSTTNPVYSIPSWIQFNIGKYFLDVGRAKINDAVVLEDRYASAWLSSTSKGNWDVNIFNGFLRGYSKLFLKIPITNNEHCSKMEQNFALSSFPYYSTFLVYCKDFDFSSIIYQVKVLYSSQVVINLTTTTLS